MMTWFGTGHIPEQLEGDPFWPFWVGSAFTRMFGASLVVLGLVVWNAKDHKRYVTRITIIFT